MKMNYMQLKFPPYEWLKALPLKRQVVRTTRGGEKFMDTEHCEYAITLFRTPTSVYGRFTYNEDNHGWVYFDVMEGGYCDQNRLSKRVKLNKKNYELICKHAQEVYEEFQRELMTDRSWQWDKTPEEYAQDHEGFNY